MFKKYITGFLLAATVLISVNLLLVFISELENLGDHQYTLSVLFKYVIFLIPQNFLDIFPYALLIGSMIAFGSMAYHSEIIALNSHGIGIKKTILIIILQTFVLSFFFTILTNTLAPTLSNKAQIIKNTALNKSTSSVDVWFKTDNSIIHVEQVITDKKLKNINIYSLNRSQLSSRLTAKNAMFSGQWHLEDVVILDIDNNTIINKDIYTISSDEFIPSQVLSSKLNKKRYNSIEDLYNNILFHDSRNIYYEDHKVIFWQKVLLPFSCCIIVFIGLPFLFTHIRSTNQTQKIIFGILLGITYFVLSNIIINMTLILNTPALMAVFISMGVFILFGTYLFNKVIKKDIPI